MKRYSTCIFLLFFSVNIFSQTDLSLGLQAYYPFTGNANDASGNNNNPSFNNATLTADRFGAPNSAYSFNGVDNYMQIPNSASLNPGARISVCAWVKPKDFSLEHCHGNMMLIKDDDRVSGPYMLMYSDGPYTKGNSCDDELKVDTAHENFYGFNTFPMGGYSPFVQKDQWQSVVWTYDDVKARLYVNCRIVDSVTVSMEDFSNSYDLFFGKINSHNYGWLNYWLNADLDEVRIYDRALNQSEINLYGDCSIQPVKFETFNSLITANLNTVNLLWTVSNELNIKDYSIERSEKKCADFVSIGKVIPKNSGSSITYSFFDEDVKQGVDYCYRISTDDNSGLRKISPLVNISLRRKALLVSVYPNSSNGIFKLVISDYKGMVDINVVNEAGRTVLNKKHMLLGDINSIPINLNKMSKGTYWIKVANATTTKIKKVVKR